jgi:hypothetical protein
MKACKNALFLMLFWGIGFQLFATTAAPLLTAEEQLAKMGEVYFKFFTNGRPTAETMANLSNMVSLAKIDGNEIFAFANKYEFAEFLKTGLPYVVLTPPSLEGTAPQMSDYSKKALSKSAAGAIAAFDWIHYPTYTGYQTIVSTLRSTYPDKVNYQVIGTSMGGRDIYAMNVSRNVGTRESEPKVLLVAGIHGNETFPIIMVMRLVDWLCSNYGIDPRATRILDSIDLWICPMHNPDGTYRGGNNTVTGAVRYNNNGIDLNRNYPPLPPNPTPTFQKEVQVLMDFEKNHVFVVEIGYHSGTEGIPYPWSAVSRAHPDAAWYAYASRKYADTCQTYGPSGFFDDICNGAGQGYQCLYQAIGTEKDYLPYILHCRGNCVEASTAYILPESSLENYWNYHYRSLLNWIQESLNGIRGIVTDSITGRTLKARVWVESHDVATDSSQMYGDLPHGNYYRPIAAGTWNVTYSCPGCTSKTVNGIVAQNSRATIVNVKLHCTPTAVVQVWKPQSSKFSITAMNGSIIIKCSSIREVVRVGIYDIQGRQVQSLTVPPNLKNITIAWNANRAGSRCYIARVESSEGSFQKPFVLSY